MYQMTDKLTRAQREQIIFNHLRGKDDPLYEVQETKYGKFIVKPKQIQIEEEEEAINEVKQEKPKQSNSQQDKPVIDKAEARRERRKRNRRAKQDAKRILDALTNLINSNNGSDSSDDEQPLVQAPQLIEPTNFNPTNLSYRRRRLAF